MFDVGRFGRKWRHFLPNRPTSNIGLKKKGRPFGAAVSLLDGGTSLINSHHPQLCCIGMDRISCWPNIRPDNPDFFYIRYLARFQIALPDIR
jgi:hypothetical protein